MRNSITKTKRMILSTLYHEQVILNYNFPLCVEYLQHKYGIKTSVSYLDRAMRELIKAGYIERIKTGYNAIPNPECFERKTKRKTKNVYRLTRMGFNYIEKTILKQESKTTGNPVGGNPVENTSEENEGEKKWEPLLKYDAFRDERTLRILKTKIFGTVVKNRNKDFSFENNEELREGIENKGATGSKVTGTFLMEDLLKQPKCIPVYNTGGYVSNQQWKVERKMCEELRKKYGIKIEEEIVLGDSWLVFAESVKALAKRERTRRESDQQDVFLPLIIESEPYHTKYFHENSEAGIEQMKIYRIPQENRREYFREKLKENKEYKKLFTKSSVAAGKNDYLFDAITSNAYVFVGYEMDIERIKNLYERMDATAMNAYDRGLIIICSKAQEELYTLLFKDTRTREMQFLKILTTEEVP